MNLVSKLNKAMVTGLANAVTFAAELFAGSPCLGPAYEPEMPEVLKK